MGIFSRFTEIVNANINALLDKAENPERMVRLIVQEIEETLVEVRTRSARVIADKKTLMRRSAKMTEEAEQWEQKAELAISRGRDDLARAALHERAKMLEKVELVNGDLALLEENLGKLSDDIVQLQKKLTDARVRHRALIMRAQTAHTRLDVQRQLHDVDVDSAMNRFEQFERKMDDLEGEVEAYDLGRRSLAEEIRSLEGDERLDAELGRLKRKLRGRTAAAQEATGEGAGAKNR